jgi:2,5-diamino-6-(ribosylamino)-4(3H)-pyrimidinone 5'-phosphate reductase
MIGQVSMQPYAGKARISKRQLSQPIPRTDFIAKHDAKSHAIALDPSGKLGWESSCIDGEHAITVLTEAVSDPYLAFFALRASPICSAERPSRA